MSAKLPIVAIVGRTNVGKSSLFNAVIGRRENIVAREAGTTRDSLGSQVEFKDRAFWLVDTAGMKTPEDDFELTIQDQIADAVSSADLIWLVIEAHTVISDEDRRIATKALKSQKPIVLIVNKADKAKNAEATDYQKLGVKPILLTSTIHKTGLEELLDTTASQLPEVKAKKKSDKLSVALLGRPNVGKSSLFNALAKKQQAVVAERAGTTRDVNRIEVKFKGQAVEVLDTAGIRRSGKIGRGIEYFSVLRSLAAIEQADICLVLIDANEPSVQLDQKIAGMVSEANKGLVLAVAKWDSLEPNPKQADRFIARIKGEFQFAPWAPVIFTSSVTGQNVTKIFDLALEINQRRSKRIKTSGLNEWLRQATALHPPAGLKNRQPKLNYIVQEDEATNFRIFGKDTGYLHWSYKRYLERKFREQFDFAGTPIKFWFIEKS